MGDGGGALGKCTVERVSGSVEGHPRLELQKRVQYLPAFLDVRMTWLWMRTDTAITYYSSHIIVQQKRERKRVTR